MFQVGNKVRIGGKSVGSNWSLGKIMSKYPHFVGFVVRIEDSGETIVLCSNPNQTTGNLFAPEDLTLISESSQKTMELTTEQKRLLDAKTQKLLKAGMIDTDMSLTRFGRATLRSLDFDEKMEDMVKKADEIIAEEEKAKK